MSYYIRKCMAPTFFSCIWCEEEFDSIEKIKIHVRQIHPFNCNSCVRVLSTWTDLVIHAQDCEESLKSIKHFLKNV
jgi:hypothetical protein